jgi:N-formylglutamate deformylase
MSETAPLYTLTPGSTPLLINVPHCGTGLPDALRARLTPAALALPDTDWHVEKLYDFAPALGAGLMAATQSRYVVDLNRDPEGKPLYPGADNTELCPSRTFGNEAIYLDGSTVSTPEMAERRRLYWQPYHDRLTAELAAIKARHGYAVLLDAHSIPSVVPRFFDGRLPDLNLGTNEGRSCAPDLADAAYRALQRDAAFSHVHNGRFKGGFITRHFGQPQSGVHALQLELAEISYLDEARPNPYDPARAAALIKLLRGLVQALLAWRPA